MTSSERTSARPSSPTAMPESGRGIGERLRKAREQAGLSLADVSARSKMPKHVIEALEREDWARLGAPVFVRGQLRSYAKLLGMPAEAIVDAAPIAADRPAELVPQTYTPKLQRVAEQAKMRLVYVVLTAAIAVPVWLATRSHINNGAENSVPLEVTDAAALAVPGESPRPQRPSSSVQAQPLVASMAPLPQAPSVSPSDGLTVRFAGESWIKLTAPDGRVIEQALVQPGQERSFAPGQLGRAVLGNASVVTVLHRGQPVDLTPYVRANVVRFAVSSEGSPQPLER